jgi:hypothetical protein
VTGVVRVTRFPSMPGLTAMPGLTVNIAMEATHVDGRRVWVFVPWKAMILASAVLTILVNLVLWLR